ncbi:hypothetical protein ACI2KR_07385 [Pseudomonas luteola]
MQAIIDFDDVLIDLHSAFLRYAHDNLDIIMDVRKHTSFGFYQQYGISDSDFLGMIQTPEFTALIRPFASSCIALERLHDQDVTINIVTSRGYMLDGYNKTLAQIQQFKFHCDKLIIVPDGKKKSECFNQIGSRIDLFVDDGFHNIVDAHKSGIVENIYLVDRPWNQIQQIEGKTVHRVSSLLDAICHFEKR